MEKQKEEESFSLGLTVQTLNSIQSPVTGSNLNDDICYLSQVNFCVSIHQRCYTCMRSLTSFHWLHTEG